MLVFRQRPELIVRKLSVSQGNLWNFTVENETEETAELNGIQPNVEVESSQKAQTYINAVESFNL